MFTSLTVFTDRNSVAMGDDMRSHAREISVRSGTRLSIMLEQAAPDIRALGWSWVAVTRRQTVAVWSVDHGVQLLVPERRLRSADEPIEVFFRYFVQIDPAWLHRRLSEGAAPDREVLDLEYRPLAQAAREREDRRREHSSSARLLTPECLFALERFGAVIDLHNDRLLRFDVAGTRWIARRDSTFTTFFCNNARVALIRSDSFAETWFVAAVGAQSRDARGLPRFPKFDPLPTQVLQPMESSDPANKRWTTRDEPTAQLSGDDAVECFRFASGRSLTEIVDSLAVE